MDRVRLGHGLNIGDVQATVQAFRPRIISLGHEWFFIIFKQNKELTSYSRFLFINNIMFTWAKLF